VHVAPAAGGAPRATIAGPPESVAAPPVGHAPALPTAARSLRPECAGESALRADIGGSAVHEEFGAKLVDQKIVSPEALRRAQEMSRGGTGSLCGNLVKVGALSEDQLAALLSDHYGVTAVDLDHIEIDSGAVKLIPGDVARKFLVLPVRRQGRRLFVVMCNPADISAIDDIQFITDLEVEACVAAESALRKVIDRYYEPADTIADITRDIFDGTDDLEIVDRAEDELDLAAAAQADQAPVVKFVNSLLADAVRRGASDIHVEPHEKQIRVRYRIDGMLYDMMSPPLRLKAAITSRLKIMAELDIAERRIPQDGRIKIRIAGRTIDLRVSTLPTIFGEKVVMRILDKSNLTLDLTKAGFEEGALRNFLRAVEAPYGMVLVTGPTGSGKTTTLYSALSRINTPSVNIMTVEDPVEYNIDGINQVHVNDDIHLTFAAALRAFLRQDPNIIMVGEIRDQETASIAVKAALTGHLVLSTLHTNDAASALTRLVDMEIEPFLVATSVNLIMAQRLLRKVCSRCREAANLHPEALQELGMTAEEAAAATVVRGKGCPDCSNTGYRGRTGVFEVLPLTTSVRELILSHESASAIKRRAIEEGMLSLRMDGLRKLKLGITSAEEVLKETAKDN
jgi:type IV pilus assembly protein PilB